MRWCIYIIAILTCFYAKAQTNNCRYLGYKPVAIDKVNNLLDKQFICIDRSGQVTINCFERLPMAVEFYRACYNSDSNELLIIGRTDFPDVGIYLTNLASKIAIDSPINVSTHCGGIENGGFFEIIVKLKPKTFLIFYSDTGAFQVRRYRIGELSGFLKPSRK